MTDDYLGKPGAFEAAGTGSSGEVRRYVRVAFDRYEITVILGPGDRFIGVRNVSVAKSFLSQSQRRDSSGFHDVSDFYVGEEAE